MNKWTPGPWSINHFVDIRGPENQPIALLSASVQTKANARLIAAAPEMAELLEIMAERAPGHISTRHGDKARALLARINGEDDGDA